MTNDLSAPFLPISGYLESPPDREPALVGDARADVAIVGGGFTGLSTALALKRAGVEAVVLDSFAWFKGLVKERRNMDDAEIATVSDGRVFTGRQGIGLKLVDGLGNEKTALAWLAKEKNVPADTPVRDYSLEPRFSEFTFLHAAAFALQAVGLSAIAQRIEEWGAVRAVERLNLDGLLALWHPPISN